MDHLRCFVIDGSGWLHRTAWMFIDCSEIGGERMSRLIDADVLEKRRMEPA